MGLVLGCLTRFRLTDVVHAMLGLLWVGLLAPAIATVSAPLVGRLRRR